MVEHNDVDKNSEPENIYLETLNTSLFGMYLPKHLKIPSKEEFWKHAL